MNVCHGMSLARCDIAHGPSDGRQGKGAIGIRLCTVRDLRPSDMVLEILSDVSERHDWVI